MWAWDPEGVRRGVWREGNPQGRKLTAEILAEVEMPA